MPPLLHRHNRNYQSLPDSELDDRPRDKAPYGLCVTGKQTYAARPRSARASLDESGRKGLIRVGDALRRLHRILSCVAYCLFSASDFANWDRCDVPDRFAGERPDKSGSAINADVVV